MAVTVTKVGTTYHVNITANLPGKPPKAYKLDMSLQRHCYRYLENAAAKPLNSVLNNSVSDLSIEADLRSLGEQVEQKLVEYAPDFKSQIAKFGQANNASFAQKIRTANTHDAFDDYLVSPSQRTYRVDNSSPGNIKVVNHCYPISGPDLWAEIDQNTFAGIVTFRRLQKAMELKIKQNQNPTKVWLGLQNDPGARNSDIYRHFTGAATQFGVLPLHTRTKIIELSGGKQSDIEIGKAIMHIADQRQ